MRLIIYILKKLTMRHFTKHAEHINTGWEKDKESKVECDSRNKLWWQVQWDKQSLYTEFLGEQNRDETEVTLANSSMPYHRIGTWCQQNNW